VSLAALGKDKKAQRGLGLGAKLVGSGWPRAQISNHGRAMWVAGRVRPRPQISNQGRASGVVGGRVRPRAQISNHGRARR
jgi:hypothetical protein